MAKVRYAVVGQGYFAQKAVLPAFAHAKRSDLCALVSSDPKKLRKLAKAYDVDTTVGYDALDALCASGDIDAVYLAVPNHLHRAFTERVARHGVHVLCEKPMAVTEEDCEAMIAACRDGGARLMIAYRLHFDKANLRAVDLVARGKIGEPRYFSAAFSFQVRAPNIRLNPRSEGGGALYDIGTYCINAARYLFRDEPIEVVAMAARGDDARFSAVEEQVSAILRFPRERLATFTVSFGAAATGRYEIVGTDGVLRLDPAFGYTGERRLELVAGDKSRHKTFAEHDQIAAELQYFSDCILDGREPEPSGREGLADVRVIRALYRSIDAGAPVALGDFSRRRRPTLEQAKSAPRPKRAPLIVNAQPET